MRLNDWRSFYGQNDLWFSTDPEKNVTLIRAENGVGKTSLLAALNWCLFNILPAPTEFENPKELVNNQSGATEAKVEVEFRHQEKLYRASRTFSKTTKKSGPLRVVGLEDGGEVPLGRNADPDKFVNSVIPKEMAPHFFFYGEATSKYTGESGSKQFAKAVRSILGATVANLALDDIQRVLREYVKLAADTSGPEAQKIHEEIAEIDQKIDTYELNLSRAIESEQAANATIQKLTADLSGVKEIKRDQSRRESLEKKLKKLEIKRTDTRSDGIRWLQQYGLPLLSTDIITNVQSLLEQQDTRKKIPGRYNEKFVNDILAEMVCICGKELCEGSSEYHHIKKMLDTATDQTMIDRIISVTTALGRLKSKCENAWDIFVQNEQTQQDIADEIADIERELSEISERLKNSDMDVIVQKENGLVAAKDVQRKAIEAQGGIKRQIDLAKQTKLNQETKLNAVVRASTDAQRYNKRKQTTQVLLARLHDRLQKEESAARAEITNKVNSIVQRYMRNDFVVEIDEDYNLKVLLHGQEAAKSTGENQILGLAFTGAIAEFAKDRRNVDSDILLSGTESPLVVDSPFGHLDASYRTGVADFLPSMASQVVLLLSTSQASEEVLNQLNDKIGMEYLLVKHNQASQGNKLSDTVHINGTPYALTEYDKKFTGTVLVEVTQ